MKHTSVSRWLPLTFSRLHHLFAGERVQRDEGHCLRQHRSTRVQGLPQGATVRARMALDLGLHPDARDLTFTLQTSYPKRHTKAKVYESYTFVPHTFAEDWSFPGSDHHLINGKTQPCWHTVQTVWPQHGTTCGA